MSLFSRRQLPDYKRQFFNTKVPKYEPRPLRTIVFDLGESNFGHREWTQSRRCEPLLEYLATLPGNGWGVLLLSTRRWLRPFGFSFSYVLLISCTLGQLCLLHVHISDTLPDFSVVSIPSIGVSSFFSASPLCATSPCGGGIRCTVFRLYAWSRSNRTPLVMFGCISSGTRIMA